MTMLQYIFIAFAFTGAGYYTYRITELSKFMRTQEAKWNDATSNAR